VSKKEILTKIDLLRHGQLVTPGLFCAPPEEPLSKKGLQNLIKATNNGRWDVIISSPYRRCREFAGMLAQQKQCRLQLNEQFKELDFGAWTGVTTDKLWQQQSEQLKQLWETPKSFVAPEGESMRAFFLRVEQGLQNILHEHENSSVLLITHAGVIRTILAKVLGISHHSVLRFAVDHARLSQIHYYPDGVYSLYSHGLRSVE